MSGAPKDGLVIAVLDASSDAGKLRAAAELLSKFSEREKGRKPLGKPEAEALIRGVAAAKSLSRYIMAYDKAGKAVGLLLLGACPGVYGEWGHVSELYVEDSAGAGVAERLVTAAVEHAAAVKLRYVTALVPPAGEKSNPDRKTLLEIVDRLGFEKGEAILAEKTIQ
jgi:hypothetical protein